MNDKMRLDQFDYSLTAHTGRAAEITVHSNREAYICILDGLERQLKDGELCEILARHDDLCELVAQVAVVRKLQRELDDRDATDADLAVLNELRRSSNPWIHREAGNLLMLIADERDQVAAHDGEAQAATPGEDTGHDLVGMECYVWWHGDGFATIAPAIGVVSEFTPCRFYKADGAEGVFSGNHARPVSMGKPEIAE